MSVFHLSSPYPVWILRTCKSHFIGISLSLKQRSEKALLLLNNPIVNYTSSTAQQRRSHQRKRPPPSQKNDNFEFSRLAMTANGGAYAAPIPIPRPPRSDSMSSSNLRPSSMVTLEESDYELPHPSFAGNAPIQRSYSPAGRQRYSQYSNSSLGLGSSPSSTPLLESLLDSNVGVNLPPPRRPGSFGTSETKSKRSSWYATAPFSFGGSATPATTTNPSLQDIANLPAPSSNEDYLGNLPPPPTFSVDGFESDHSSLPPPPTPPFIMNVSSPRKGGSQHASNHSAHSSISSMASFQSAQGNSNTPSRSGSPTPVAPGLSPVVRPGSPVYQPFNFQSTTLESGASRPAQRRGHRYKHSSVSMNFFREDVRAPLAIPASLQIPTLSECSQSMSKEQKVRITWGAFHLFVTILVYKTQSPYTALSALAHLLFYDAMGALMCAVVDIIGNFDVWKLSSIHFPFGLERAEVLAGFALSILLIFMGGDIMSHCIQEFVGTLYGGEAAHSHGHSHNHGDEGMIHWTRITITVCLAIIVTIVSAVGLDNHTRISRALRNSGQAPAFSYLPWILSNPSHFVTVTFSAMILVFPFVADNTRRVIDTILTPCIAGSMCYMGWMLAKSLGGMMVMSFPGENRIDEVEQEVLKLPSVVSVSNISVWQVHHSVWLACMKVVMNGSEAQEQHIRERASRLIQDIMGAASEFDEEDKTNSKLSTGSGLDRTRWETTIDIERMAENTMPAYNIN